MRTLLLCAAALVLAACGREAPAPAAGGTTVSDSTAPAPASVPAAPPRAAGAPVDSADFRVAGVALGDDSTHIRRLLGAPDSVSADENPYDPGSELATWHYADLQVLFSGTEIAHGISLTGPRHATLRGARVGDTPERIRALYGDPTAGDDESWDYMDSADPSGLVALRFSFQGGRVSEIFLGAFLD